MHTGSGCGRPGCMVLWTRVADSQTEPGGLLWIMNFLPSRQNQPPARPKTVIRGQARWLCIAAADARALHEHQLGNFAAAAEIYRRLLMEVPDYAEGYNNRGVVLQKLHRYEEALSCYDQAVAFKPDYANAHYNRGLTLKKLNRHGEALAGYDQAIALMPGHVEAHNNRGVLLQEMKRYAGALASYDRVLELAPGHVEALNNRGLVLASQGEMAGAEGMFRQALEMKPDFPAAWFNLTGIRHYEKAGAADLTRIRLLLNQPGGTPDDREHLLFALGKICDDGNRHEEAFECYRQANRIRNGLVAYDPGQVTRFTDGIIEVFSRDFLRQPFTFASADRSPLFIVGMPRSGTTLLASMLSNHSAIATAGELSALTDLTTHWREFAGGGAPFPAAARQVTPDLADRHIRDYLSWLHRDARPDTRHVIDKNPLNFRNLGLIAMLFPRARIIHCTRHPLDTGLSNYFQRFPLRLDYAFDLRHIGHFYGEYTRLMAHWRSLPGLNMLEIGYEDMVLHTENTARRALEFLELGWDEKCLAPHTNPCAVDTASHWQVRQPIYRRSLGRWRHYEAHLGPLKEALLAAGVAV